MQETQVRSLIKELRSHMLCGVAKRKKKLKQCNWNGLWEKPHLELCY